MDFGPGLNIFHGKNGSGKTTMLHVLANLFEGDLERFCHLQFTRINVTTSTDQSIEISQSQPRDQPPTVHLTLNGEGAGSATRGEKLSPATAGALRSALRGRPVYLPAFRSVLEAITRTSTAPFTASDDDHKRDLDRIVDALITEQRADSRRRYGMHYMRSRAEALAHKTLLCRRWFGPFVPLVRYPSLWEVADELSEEVQHAYMELSATDQKTVSTVFTNVLEAVLSDNRAPLDKEEPAELLASVKKHLEALDPDNTEVGVIYRQLRDLLSTSGAVSTSGTNVHAIIKVYEKALAERATSQERLFAKLRTFEQSVNRFLAEEGRHLVLDNRPLGHTWARSFRAVSKWVELPGKRRTRGCP